MQNKKNENKDENYNLSYENCWKAIIRPPRDDYDISELGTKKMLSQKKLCIREDYTLMTNRGYMIECSFFRFDLNTREPTNLPCVIYLHGNSSSRIEGKKMAYYLLSKNIELFVFDFPGSGKSEGEYISLGYHEQDVVKIVIDFVQKLPGVGNIGIWGRSMGAATTLLYVYKDERIKAICVDSPFADFNQLALQLCKKEKGIPNFIVSFVLFFVKKTIRKKNDMQIDTLKPIDYVDKAKVPAIFIHAKHDELIPYEHTIELCNKYGGKKSINIVEGDHNTPRPKHIVIKIVNFFKENLDICENNNEEDEKLKIENNIMDDNINKINDVDSIDAENGEDEDYND